MSNYRLDVDDACLLSLYNQGNSIRNIGRIVNMEHHAVKNRLIALGINFTTNIKKDTSNFIFPLDMALKLYREGKTCNAIAKVIDCDSKVVKKHLIKAGIKLDTPINKHIKLNNYQINRIMALYNDGFNYTDIAKIFNTSGQTIKNYLKKYNIVE